MASIPKVIHYCWLGKNEKSDLVRKCMNSWEKHASDYEIIEWNEENFPFDEIKAKSNYVAEAIDKKAWAFVTDYMRLYVLYNEGGVYLDTDVELVKPLDDLLVHDSFMSLESQNTVCTAVIGSKPEQEWIKKLLDCYNKRNFIIKDKLDKEPNSQYIYKFLSKGKSLKGIYNYVKLESGLCVFASEYFSPKNYATMKLRLTQNTFAIHHYSGGWKSNSSKFKDLISAIITRIIGENKMDGLKKKIKKY